MHERLPSSAHQEAKVPRTSIPVTDQGGILAGRGPSARGLSHLTLERLVSLFHILWTWLANEGAEGCSRAEEWGQGLPAEAAEEEEMRRHCALSCQPTCLVPEQLEDVGRPNCGQLSG